VKKQLYQPTAV